jgi:hypothetical protein
MNPKNVMERDTMDEILRFRKANEAAGAGGHDE